MNPVSLEAYLAVTEGGEPWPDEIGTLGNGTGLSAQATGERRKRRAEGGRPVRRDRYATPASGQLQRFPVGSGGIDGSTPGHGPMDRVNADGTMTASCGMLGHNSGRSAHEIGRGIDAGRDGRREADAAEGLADEIALLWTEVTAWLERVGVIADQVTADRCANFADAFASFEKQAEELRTMAKKPVLDAGRKIDARWKPVVAAADEAKRSCKKALEPFLIAETARIEREADLLGRSSEGAKAGTFGRTISLRRVRRVRVSDRSQLIAHYHGDHRLFTDETVQKLLLKLAEIDLQAGQWVPGAELAEEQVAA